MIANSIDPVILFPTRVLHLFTLSLFAAAAFADKECPSRLSYWGYSGPEQWPKFPIAENRCGGERQSPISLPKLTPTPGPPIQVGYVPGNATILNTGHDIEVTPAGDANKIKIEGKGIYKLVQFHFHVPSEHTIPGVAAVAEMHILHQLESGSGEKYAVIGVMITTSETPTLWALAPVFARLPEKVCDRSDATINLKGLLPETLSSYYTYAGSLTTPPCTENVTWYVLDAARTILSSDLKKLGDLGVNARPIQNNLLPVTYVRAP